MKLEINLTDDVMEELNKTKEKDPEGKNLTLEQYAESLVKDVVWLRNEDQGFKMNISFGQHQANIADKGNNFHNVNLAEYPQFNIEKHCDSDGYIGDAFGVPVYPLKQPIDNDGYYFPTIQDGDFWDNIQVWRCHRESNYCWHCDAFLTNYTDTFVLYHTWKTEGYEVRVEWKGKDITELFEKNCEKK